MEFGKLLSGFAKAPLLCFRYQSITRLKTVTYPMAGPRIDPSVDASPRTEYM